MRREAAVTPVNLHLAAERGKYRETGCSEVGKVHQTYWVARLKNVTCSVTKILQEKKKKVSQFLLVSCQHDLNKTYKYKCLDTNIENIDQKE